RSCGSPPLYPHPRDLVMRDAVRRWRLPGSSTRWDAEGGEPIYAQDQQLLSSRLVGLPDTARTPQPNRTRTSTPVHVVQGEQRLGVVAAQLRWTSSNADPVKPRAVQGFAAPASGP